MIGWAGSEPSPLVRISANGTLAEAMLVQQLQIEKPSRGSTTAVAVPGRRSEAKTTTYYEVLRITAVQQQYDIIYI